MDAGDRVCWLPSRETAGFIQPPVEKNQVAFRRDLAAEGWRCGFYLQTSPLTGNWVRSSPQGDPLFLLCPGWPLEPRGSINNSLSGKLFTWVSTAFMLRCLYTTNTPFPASSFLNCHVSVQSQSVCCQIAHLPQSIKPQDQNFTTPLHLEIPETSQFPSKSTTTSTNTVHSVS